MILVVFFVVFFVLQACDETQIVEQKKTPQWHARVLNEVNYSLGNNRLKISGEVNSLALDSTGDVLFMASLNSEVVYTMTTSHGSLFALVPTKYQNGLKTSYKFSGVLGLVVNKNNIVYFTSSYIISPSSSAEVAIYQLWGDAATLVAGSVYGTVDKKGIEAQFGENLHAMALSADEKILYVADTNNDAVRVVIIESQEVKTLLLKDSQGTPITLKSPSGIAVDTDNTLYLVTGKNNIVRITPTSFTAGIAYVLALEGVNTDLNKPEDIKINAQGALYVADTKNNRVLKINLNAENTVGTVQVILNSQTKVDNKVLNNPMALAVNKAGTVIYVGDTYNKRVLKLEYKLSNGF